MLLRHVWFYNDDKALEYVLLNYTVDRIIWQTQQGLEYMKHTRVCTSSEEPRLADSLAAIFVATCVSITMNYLFVVHFLTERSKDSTARPVVRFSDLDSRGIHFWSLGWKGLSLFGDIIDIACCCMMLLEKLCETVALRALVIAPAEGPSTVALD